ncbi:hypothetical protein [Pseudomonas sp. Kh13]|uniref:hypothetical protein n=1 Tax=Pseudomonas sp. Kh13 TaxID=2093744 RepID=UPI002115A971|nr:hypothetical protein [Pseudomonas sp. Kh13]
MLDTIGSSGTGMPVIVQTNGQDLPRAQRRADTLALHVHQRQALPETREASGQLALRVNLQR